MLLLLNFQTVFSLLALLSAIHTGVCTVWRSGESEGVVKGIAEGIHEGVVSNCFCRNWQKRSILETGIPKQKTGCLLCKTGGCFYFPFSDCSLFYLANFLCILRITCHGVFLIFLHKRPSHWQSVG